MSQIKPSPDKHSTENQQATRGAEVFVGGLARTITEAKIHEVFGSCGQIIEIRMIKDQSGKPKGYCFVRFMTKEAATRAIKEKSGSVLEGKTIGVVPSTDQDALFLGNLKKDWSAYEFDKLVRQAFQDVLSVDLAMPLGSDDSHGQSKLNRGFAFVKFTSHAAAARAYRMGSKADFVLGGNWHPTVEWAQEEPEIDPEELAKIKIAFVRNLPTDADEDYLRKLFEPFGKLEKVVLSKKGRTPVGFAHFVQRSDLDNAVKEMKGKIVQGPSRGPTFKLEVAVAKPMDKTKKRAHGESQRKQTSKTSSQSYQLRDDQPSSSPEDYKPKALKLKHPLEDPIVADPHEAAVVLLPVAVKERLLRILRLGIASRFDIGIQCIRSLNELPELAAISVLDQFLLSGADRHDKEAYLSMLISKHSGEKMVLDQNPSYLPRAGEITYRDSVLPSLSDRVHLPASLASRVGTSAARDPVLLSYSHRAHMPVSVDYLASRVGRTTARDPVLLSLSDRVHMPATVDSLASAARGTAMSGLSDRVHIQPAVDSLASHVGTTASRYDGYNKSPVMSRYSLSFIDLPQSRGTTSQRLEETSSQHLHRHPVSSTNYANMGLDSHHKTPAANHQSSRPQVRFDPFTGRPYKFDPFTGEPIEPES